MFSFFSKRSKPTSFPFGTDIHSHLLPGLDDGVKTNEEAAEVITRLNSLGFNRLITTPHINDIFKNDAATIRPALTALNEYLRERGISVEIEAAAEYYLDENVMSALEKNQELLTFGKRHLLFETNFLAEPFFLKDFIFKAISNGYRPLLAHPERYAYMTIEKAEELHGRGALFQVNMLSLIGFYSKPVQKIAEALISKGLVDFLGSDCHNMVQADLLGGVLTSKALKKALDLDLLNKRL